MRWSRPLVAFILPLLAATPLIAQQAIRRWALIGVVGVQPAAVTR